ncbi:Tfp pilus assembly protein FimT [Clostridium aceticum]|uniref:Tfp pilus assembly protein FimT n=1 Tax=Clostridium aceticum TaxID=84022 RepID=A0A0D8I8K8_9CLOT|nr:type II secretion system protein [Clostridium aceticum]AKL96218.1 Tfp pilus assembly protein FimT [Clostridium aceticum]KJF26630.1 hypothetical protein TZ02_12220 [Clostridium aceticum]
MKVNTWKLIRCSSKRGYTLVELMVVIVIMGMIAAFGANSFSGLISGYENTRIKTEQSVSDLKTIAYIDRLLQGCDSVQVLNSKTLEIVKNGSKEVFKAGKFGKEEDIDFIDNGDQIIVVIGGEECCLPILLKEQSEEI